MRPVPTPVRSVLAPGATESQPTALDLNERGLLTTDKFTFSFEDAQIAYLFTLL